MRLLLFLLLCPATFFAQNASIQTAISNLAKDPTLAHGSLSVSVIDVKSGELIAAHDAERCLTPASSMKVVTTAAALSLLGADYRYKTEIQYDGTIDSAGVLHGNIYLKGYGDPTLGSDYLEETDSFHIVLAKMVQAIKTAGIQGINGRIVGDGTYFDSPPIPDAWQWNDLGNYYGAGSFGLNIHENLYELDFQQVKDLGAQPIVANTRPEMPNMIFQNELTSAGARTGDKAYIYGAPYSYICTLRGTIPVGNATTFSIKGSIPDPPYYAAYHLDKALKSRGFQIEKLPITQRELDEFSQVRKVIYTHQSPPLSVIVREANHESINLFCEVLLKTIGKKVGENSSTKAGVKVIKNWLIENGVDTQIFFMEDGSGLSARNALTSKQLATVLKIMGNTPSAFDIYYESFAIGGTKGTLKGMFKGTPAYGKIRAKSGSMRRIRSYTGYVYTNTGRLLSFSIIANNFTGSQSQMKRKMEQVMVSLYR